MAWSAACLLSVAARAPAAARYISGLAYVQMFPHQVNPPVPPATDHRNYKGEDGAQRCLCWR